MWVQRKKTNGETFLLVFVESALAGAPCCVPYVWRCEFQDPERRRKKKEEGKLNTVFLLSLKCHERSAECACRG